MGNPPPRDLAPGVHRPGDYRTPQDPSDGRTKVMQFSYKSAGILCYLPLCCCFLGVLASVLWLASEPDDNRFVRFHAIQGLLLSVVAFILSFLFHLLGAGARLTTRMGTGSEAAGAGAGVLVDLIALAVFLPLLVIEIVAMVKTGQGEMWKLPVIGDIAEKKA